MADAEVRTAALSDAAEIARLQLSTWRTAYARLLPDDVLAGVDETATRESWAEALRGGQVTVLLATEGGEPVGFCAAGRAPAAESASADGTPAPDEDEVVLVSALLVEPRWGRRGHGGRLLATMAQRLAADGATRGITWVPEGDEASLAFFAHAGWEADGTVRTLDAGGRPVRELRLTGSLDLRLAH